MQNFKRTALPLAPSLVIAQLHVNALANKAIAYPIVDQLSKIIGALNDVNTLFCLRGESPLGNHSLTKSQAKQAAAAIDLVERVPTQSMTSIGKILQPLVKDYQQPSPTLEGMLKSYTQTHPTKLRALELKTTGKTTFSDALDDELIFLENMSREDEQRIREELRAFAKKAEAKYGAVKPLHGNKDKTPMLWFSTSDRTRDFCRLAHRVLVRGLEKCDDKNIETFGVAQWREGGVGHDGSKGKAARADDWKRVIKRWIITHCRNGDRDGPSGAIFQLDSERSLLAATLLAHAFHGVGFFFHALTGLRVERDSLEADEIDNATVQCWGINLFFKSHRRSALLNVMNVTRGSIAILLRRLRWAGLLVISEEVVQQIVERAAQRS